MEKVYRLLPWWNTTQALAWLQSKTATALSSDDLLQLCDAGECAAYLDCRERRGEMVIYLGRDFPPVRDPVTGRGICRVEHPLHLTNSVLYGTHVIGAVLVEETGKVIEGQRWLVEFGDSLPTTLFRKSDIQALAEKLNAAADESSPTEHEGLYRQLEQERSAREAAEQRANQMEAGNLHRQSGEQTGLTFPYSTRQLEAMRDAAEQFWQSHDRSKPAPYGIQKQVQNFLTARTGENGRKVAELAAAIKPDDLPKT